MNETEGMLERSAPVFRCTVCSTYQWGPSCACGIDTARQCTATDRGAEQWRGLVNQIGATERERDSHGETIVQLAADLDRVSDDLELHRVAYKAANEELQDIYATIRPIQAEGNVKAVDVYRSLLDANSTLRVQLNAAVRAREILEEERTTTGVKAVGLAAKNHALREEREHIKSVVWTLNNALTTYHDFTSELLEAQRLASQVPGLYATDDEPEPAEVVGDVKFEETVWEISGTPGRLRRKSSEPSDQERSDQVPSL